MFLGPCLAHKMGVLVREGYTQTVVESEEALRPGGAMLAAEYFDQRDVMYTVDRLIREHRFRKPEIQNERWDNGRTALFEALSASGHLTRVDFEGPAQLVNNQVIQRLLNAYNPNLPEWELQRRRLEIAEEVVIHKTFESIQRGELPADTMVAVISDFPASADPDEAFAMGYRGLNNRGMTRVTYFFENSYGVWCRSFEQVSRSNSHDRSSARAIQQLTGHPSVWLPNEEYVLGSPLLVTSDVLPDGVVDLQRILDENQGQNTRYGDDLANKPQHPAYEDLRFVSAEREAQVANYIGQLAKLEQDLDKRFIKGRITYNQKLQAYHKEVDRMVNEICLLSPEYAKDACGEASAEVFREAAQAMATGNAARTRALLAEAITLVDPRARPICGGGGFEDEKSMEKELENLLKGAKESSKNWKWKRGVCVVPKCRKEAEVGPCGVCRSCQGVYDKGGDPTK